MDFYDEKYFIFYVLSPTKIAQALKPDFKPTTESQFLTLSPDTCMLLELLLLFTIFF